MQSQLQLRFLERYGDQGMNVALKRLGKLKEKYPENFIDVYLEEKDKETNFYNDLEKSCRLVKIYYFDLYSLY